MKIIAATNNKGKLKEMRAIFGDLATVVSLSDMGVNIDVVEDGDTFLHNARKKAREIQAVTGGIVFADDSGLTVDALNGAPGVYSARFAGEDATDEENVEKLLLSLKDKQDRTGHFVCTIVLLKEDGTEYVAEGACSGVIAEEPHGENGFGYDPVFYIPELGKTMAELSPEEKNQISHRRKALDQIKEFLK